MAQYLYIDNRDGFGPRDFTSFLMDRDQFFQHTKNEPQLFEFRVTKTGDDPASTYGETVRKTADLKAYWRLGETGGTVAADTSGQGNSGTYQAGVVLNQAAAIGDGNPAASFPGNASTGYLSIADNATLRLNGAFTIEFWIKPTGTGLQGVLGKGNGDDVTGQGWFIGEDDGLLLFARNGVTKSIAVTHDTWNHVVITYDLANVRFYIGGAPAVAPSAVSYPTNNDTSVLTIGKTILWPFTGLLDEVAFYSRALSDQEVFDHYAVRAVVSAPNNEWVVPKRGAFVKFHDDRWDSRHTAVPDSILFTGYVTEDPDPVFLGQRLGEKVWAYRVQCTSEEFLANSKKLPPKTYVNQTRGFIIKDLLQEMFKASSPFPYNLNGIMDGGLEKVYQVDTAQTLAELLQTFAAADGYTYWIVDSYVYYAPEGVVTSYSDPAYSLVIDELDPRYNPDNLDMNRVSREIVNDVTVFGEDEATDVVRENFVSDGYQGAHNLAFDPFGLEESALIQDDFTGDIDTSIWKEADTGPDYIQAFEGALNIIGGPLAATYNPSDATAKTVYLLARKPIELSGVIQFRDGEIYFPPSPTGAGYIGGLYTNASLANNTIWNGWFLNNDARLISALGPGLTVQGAYSFVATRHYVLRRTIQVDRQLSTQQYTQPSTGSSYSITNANNPVRLWMSWTIDEINNDDPNNVQTTSTLVAQYTTTAVVPSFVLYAASVPNNCHYVTNFLSVRRPQQAVLVVDGHEKKLGSYLDGGVATLQSDNAKGKLAWYQIPGPPNALLSYPNTVLGETTNSVPGEGCIALWRLGETSGTTAYDSSGQNHTGTSVNVTVGGAGAILSDDDGSYSFNGGAYVTGAGFGMAFAAAGSIEAWFKTSSSVAVQTIFSNRDSAGAGEFYQIIGGRIVVGNSHAAASFQSNRAGLNDGRWHHMAVTYLNGGGVSCHLYIDGVLDASFALPRFPPANPWFIGLDLRNVTLAPGQGYFVGSLDEVAVYYGITLSTAQVLNHYNLGLAASTSVVTVPKAGARIALTYYRKQKSRARLKSLESITTERERYRDDGIRQRVMRTDDIQPPPRTSEECLALAQAVLYDSAVPRYEGTYSFETIEGNVTQLLFWPRPGDLVRCTLDLPDGDELDQFLSIQNVNSQFLGKGTYRISLGFGPINRYDIVIRNLILQRKSSVSDPVIQDQDTDTLEAVAVGYPYPADLTDCQVTQSSITATQFTATLAQAGIPADVVNYEVREDDTGWGKPNYVTRFRATSQVFTRTKRDIQYYIRPYNASGFYARKSAFIRVVAPLANTLVMNGAKGDIDRTRVRVIIPIPRDPDYAGITVQASNSGGATLYKGNGDIHTIIATGVTVLLTAGQMSVDIPNPTAATAYTVFVNSYNLLGLAGTGQTLTITSAADGAWAATATTYGANNGASWNPGGQQIAYTRSGSTMTVAINLVNTSITGPAPTLLTVQIPAGVVSIRSVKTICALRDNGTRTSGTLEVGTGSTITIKRLDQNALGSPASGTTDVEGQITFEYA